MRNINSTSVVIVCYPNWGGGKFLINCLGLSKDCYLQHIKCVQKQRNDSLLPDNKLNLLLERLNQTQTKWKDLELGCFQLFRDPHNEKFFYSLIDRISHEDKLFFLVAHSVHDVKVSVSIWPNSKKILLKNTNGFMNWRLGIPQDFDRHSVPGLSQDFTQEQQQEIIDIVGEFLEWDVDWYFDKKKCMTELQKLYANLGLVDFDEGLVGTFYDAYMEKINEIKNFQQNKHDTAD